MKKLILVAALGLTILPLSSYAGDEVINQLRFFYGQNNINPKEANETVEAAGLGSFKKWNQYGIEASRDVVSYLNLGLRLGLRNARTEPLDSSVSSDYYAGLYQTTLSAIITVPFVKTEKFKFEAFTGFGMGDTTLSIQTASEDGKFTRTQTLPIAMIGASVAFGYKYVFLKLEGGYEYNKVSGLTKSGTVTGNLDKIDLSGSYFNVGIMIDGLKLGRL